MPAKSKQQQKFFGVVKAMQKGDIPKKGEAGEVAKDMSKKEVDKMASVKHKGLPKKVTKKEIKEMIRQELISALTEAPKMTPAKVQKAQKELVTVIDLLKKNFPMYKAAKEAGDEKKLEKHRKIALDLTKKKRDLELALDKALGGLYQDAELELTEDKQPTEKDLSIINKARAKAALRQISTGKRDDGMGKFTAKLFGVTPSGEVQQITDPKDINMYNKVGLAEGKLNEANIWDETGDAQDKKFFNELIARAKEIYSTIAPKKYNLDNFEKDLEKLARGIIEPEMEQYAAANKPFGEQTPEERKYTTKVYEDWMTAVRQAFRTTTSFSGYKAASNSFIDKARTLFKVLMMAAGGDTSSMGYKVMAKWKDQQKEKEQRKAEKQIDMDKVFMKGADRSELTDEGKIKEAAPRMRKDPDSEQLMSILKDVSRIENKMKSRDRSRHSHIKRDFKKFFDSLMNLKSRLDRQGPTIPEGINEALPKFKTPFEAYDWIMSKRTEAMDIEMDMLQKTKDIIQTQKDMEQEAEPGGGPIADKYGKELDKLQMEHEALRKQFAAIMAEIDEYDQNY